jgi:hypothetical protein
MNYSHVVCLVDNDTTRVDVARTFYPLGVPVVFAGFNATAEGGYCFIQESAPGTPCFGCLFPDAVRAPRGAACGAGFTIDIVFTVAGFVTWALDALVGNRQALWRYKEVSLAGFEHADGSRIVERRPDCSICGPTRSALHP